MVVLCVGMAVGQDVAHDVDKGATKTGHVIKHAGKNRDLRLEEVG